MADASKGGKGKPWGKGPSGKGKSKKGGKGKGKPDAPETSGALTEGVEATPPSTKNISDTPATTEPTKEEPKDSKRKKDQLEKARPAKPKVEKGPASPFVLTESACADLGVSLIPLPGKMGLMLASSVLASNFYESICEATRGTRSDKIRLNPLLLTISDLSFYSIQQGLSMSERDYVKMIGHNETISHPVDVISDIYTLMPSVRLTNANAPVVSRLIGTFKFEEWIIHSVGSPI